MELFESHNEELSNEDLMEWNNNMLQMTWMMQVRLQNYIKF